MVRAALPLRSATPSLALGASLLSVLIAAPPAPAAAPELGPEIQIDAVTDRRECCAAVTERGGDGFVAAWEQHTDGARAQRFDSAGAPVGAEIEVTAARVDGVRLAAGDDGFSVGWTTSFLPYSVGLQRFERDGSALAAELVVDGATSDWRGWPDVAALPAGRFVVVWREADSPIGPSRTVGRFVDADGVPRGDDLLMSGWTRKGFPSRCAGPSILATAQPAGIVGQLFRVEIPVFADDFESGDLCAWGGTHGTRDLC